MGGGGLVLYPGDGGIDNARVVFVMPSGPPSPGT